MTALTPPRLTLERIDTHVLSVPLRTPTTILLEVPGAPQRASSPE